MLKGAQTVYDAVIVGAGISGLVCGCYLAKAGMKVLIVEQHHKPGGYCTSFKRKEFIFDAAAHSFGGYKYGHVGKVFKELEIEKKLKFHRYDPSDIIITTDYKIAFWSDLDKTIKEFQSRFPDEALRIGEFFSFLFNPNPNSFSRIRSWTFKNLLDQYLCNDKLKAILSFPLFGNGGLPPSKISAFLGAKIFKEFLLDGGYYPEGCMQDLPNALAERFKEFGGKLILSMQAKKIQVRNNEVQGIVTEDGKFLSAKYIISNCDARETFLKLLGKEKLTEDFLVKLNGMIPSLSIFIAYLGIDKEFDNLPAPGVNVWYLFTYDLNRAYRAAERGDLDDIGGYMLHVLPDKKSVLAFMNIAYKGKNFWTLNKINALESFIKRIDREAIPGLSTHIIFKDAATPCTLQRYTSNYQGAAYGWAGTPAQLADPDFRKPSFMKGLYLTGHWTTQGLGIPGVVYVGYDTAKKIKRKEKLII